MVHAGAEADAQTLNRFRVEADSVARLQHPNIVQIHDVGQHAGSPYLVLELVESRSLAKGVAGTPQPARWATNPRSAGDESAPRGLAWSTKATGEDKAKRPGIAGFRGSLDDRVFCHPSPPAL
jgi:hypothetical protein